MTGWRGQLKNELSLDDHLTNFLQNSLGRENQNDTALIQQRLGKTRPEILETLSKYFKNAVALYLHAYHSFSGQCGHATVAYDLAEHYQDFATLVALCNTNPKEIYPPSANPNAERIQSYIFKYKEDFAKELLQWYIQHGP